MRIRVCKVFFFGRVFSVIALVEMRRGRFFAYYEFRNPCSTEGRTARVFFGSAYHQQFAYDMGFDGASYHGRIFF